MFHAGCTLSAQDDNNVTVMNFKNYSLCYSIIKPTSKSPNIVVYDRTIIIVREKCKVWGFNYVGSKTEDVHVDPERN